MIAPQEQHEELQERLQGLQLQQAGAAGAAAAAVTGAAVAGRQSDEGLPQLQQVEQQVRSRDTRQGLGTPLSFSALSEQGLTSAYQLSTCIHIYQLSTTCALLLPSSSC